MTLDTCLVPNMRIVCAVQRLLFYSSVAFFLRSLKPYASERPEEWKGWEEVMAKCMRERGRLIVYGCAAYSEPLLQTLHSYSIFEYFQVKHFLTHFLW